MTTDQKALLPSCASQSFQISATSPLTDTGVKGASQLGSPGRFWEEGPWQSVDSSLSCHCRHAPPFHTHQMRK